MLLDERSVEIAPMQKLNLTLAEIKDITGKTHRQKQALVLAAMSIPFKIRPDGTILVSREAYNTSMGCNHDQPEKVIEPDFGMMAN